MRQAPCQPNLLKFSNMCQRDYPAPSDIYLLPNPAVARLAPANAPPARMMSQARRCDSRASADKDLPQPTPGTFRRRRRRWDAVLLLQAGNKKERKGKEGNVATATECLYVS